MVSPRAGIVVTTQTNGSNARRHGRIRVSDATSTVGKVLDISASGMRVRCRTRPPEPGTQVRTTIAGPNCRTESEARVVWVKKLGWLHFEMGLEFVSPSAEVRACLLEIARGAGDGQGLAG